MHTNRYISLVFNLTLLIIVVCWSPFSVAQLQGSSSGAGLNSPVNYQARDSIVADIPNQIVRLYGDANVQYEDIDLKADLIEIDIRSNEVIARYSLDSLGNPVGKPLFSSAGEESQCEYIKYNFETKKGIIKEVRMQQGEGYLHMAESKVHPNEQIHFRNGKFTTCDREEPHFHFKLKKAIVVPEKRIVTGPVYMEILKVPTPLAAPFGFFPSTDSKKAGLILPRIANSNEYGFGLQDLGYYIPLGDFWETYFYASIYTTGRWAAQNISNYYRKYKYRGSFSLRFEQFRGKFYNPNVTNKWTINWNHNQEAQAHPSITFSTNINFISDNTAKTSLDAINPNYFNNTFNSSINLSKAWYTKKFSGSTGLVTSLQQNSISGNYSLELPSYNFSVSRFDLGVLRRSKVGSKWYEKITVTYNLNAQNSIFAPDSIFNASDFGLIRDYATNGIEHRSVVQTNLRIFGGRFTFTPSATYREIWNFQHESRAWNPDTQKIDTVETNGFRASRDVLLRANLVTNFYGYYKFKGPAQTKFRHIASPSVSYTYRPDLGLHEEIQVDTLGNTAYYSPFAQSKYREAAQGASGSMTFSLNNTLDMKRRDRKDTVNQSFKSYRLIDALSVNGSYDFLRDSMKLGNFQLAFRTSKFFEIFSFQSGGTFSPYGWDNTSGEIQKEYAWQTNQGLGRFQAANGVLNANFTSQQGRKKQKEIEEKANETGDANTISQATDPNLKSYEIPWVLNLSYNINYTRQSQFNTIGTLVDTFSLVQTLVADGDVSFNEKWKIDYRINYDIQSLAFSGFNLGLWRDLHCWETSLTYQQFGPFTNPNPETNPAFKVNWSILFKIGVKASLFQDIKYDHTFRNF